jgi:ABC-type multidrug transport system ATPase subunit
VPLLSLKNISKSFNGKLVLSNCSLEVRSGERILISGDNGIGKSTLLKIIAGHLFSDVGSVELNGIDLLSKSFTEIKKEVALVSPLEDILYPRITGLENILYFSRLLGLDDSLVKSRIEKWRTSELFCHSMSTPFYDCSQGMKRVLSLFILTLSNPRVLLFDESFKSFDSKNREEVLTLLDSEFKESVIILCSHHKDEFSQFKNYTLTGELIAN